MSLMVNNTARKIQHCFQQYHLYRPYSSVIQYVQGQSPSQGLREYFYFINHQGMVMVTVYVLCIFQNDLVLYVTKHFNFRKLKQLITELFF